MSEDNFTEGPRCHDESSRMHTSWCYTMQPSFGPNQVYSGRQLLHISTNAIVQDHRIIISVYKMQECIRKLWAEGSRNWERLSVCRWWILTLHVLLLPEPGCEIYGPYKGSSSCGWQTVYIFQDRRSWLLMPCKIATKISLWVTMQGICPHMDWYVDLNALVVTWKCNVYVLVFV